MAFFSFPPLQQQIHLQYMLLPLVPCHLGVYRHGGHFGKLNYFPLGYVVSALQALVVANVSLPTAPEMTAIELVDAVAKYGVSYDVIYEADVRRFELSNAL